VPNEESKPEQTRVQPLELVKLIAVG